MGMSYNLFFFLSILSILTSILVVVGYKPVHSVFFFNLIFYFTVRKSFSLGIRIFTFNFNSYLCGSYFNIIFNYDVRYQICNKKTRQLFINFCWFIFYFFVLFLYLFKPKRFYLFLILNHLLQNLIGL